MFLRRISTGSLKSILDFIFLYASTSAYYGKEGQKSSDPVVFMKLMLVGYLENLNSDRRIISTSRMRMDILYFPSYDLDEELPWHSTLSRTRQLYGEEQFISIFKLVLKQCVAKGLLSGKRQAIDSVFVKANAALSSMVEREVLQDAGVYSKELDAHTEEKESPDQVSPVKNGNNSTKSTQAKPTKRSNKTYTSHIQAFHADKGDAACLPDILSPTLTNLSENGLELKEVLAHTGYSSKAALEALRDHHITGYIPNSAGYKFSREGFTYYRLKDRYTCSQGKFLTYSQFRTDQSNTYKVYKTGVKDCRECPLKGTCANPVGIKSLEDAICKELYDQMHLRM